MLDGRKLKTLRLNAGLSAAQLGEAAGVTGRHIRRMEAGGSEPTFAVAVAMADAIGVPVVSLIHDQKPANGSTSHGKTTRGSDQTAKSDAAPARTGA